MLFSINSVSASDTNDNLQANDNSDIIGASDTNSGVNISNELSISDSNGDVLGSGEDNKLQDSTSSYSNLAYLIKLTDDEVVLTQDYTYSESEDSSYASTGITISKNNFVIDGAGHTIDGNWLAKTFTITGNNVTLKNLKITHCVESITWSGDNGNLIKCNFTDNIHNNSASGNRGSGIYWSGSNAYVSNCIFNNMTGKGSDGYMFIKFVGININVEYTTFANSTNELETCERLRMAVFVDASAVGINTFKKCNFENVSTATEWRTNPGILFVRAVEATVDECNFIECHSVDAILYSSGPVVVKNTKFENTSVYPNINDAAIVYGCYLLNNCTFINQLGGSSVIKGESYGPFDAIDCTFDNTSMLYLGGGQATGCTFKNMPDTILNNNQYGSFVNCTFKNNDLSNVDYLINLSKGSNVFLNNNTFISNTVKTALINIEEGVTCNVNNLKYLNNNVPVNIINNGATFIDSSHIFVCENGIGDGFSRNSPTNLTNALNIVSVGGTITIINGTHNLTGSVTFNCNIIGENNVIINADIMTLRNFRSIECITFNGTNRLTLNAHDKLINVNFTNPKTTNTQLIFSYAALHTELTNINIINGTFNNKHVFGFGTSQGDFQLMGAWSLDNLTIKDCTGIDRIFHTTIITNSNVNNLVVKNTAFKRFFHDSGIYVSSAASFNHINITDCNVSEYLFYTSPNERCSDLSFNHINVNNVNCSNNIFIQICYNCIFDDLVINNINSSNSNFFVVDLNNGNNVIKNSKFSNIINSATIISNSGSSALDNVNITNIEGSYAVKDILSTALKSLLVKDCTFTESIVDLGNNSELDYCTFRNVVGSVNVTGNSVHISESTFNTVNSVNGAVNIVGESCLISNCVFTNNVASENGGAIHINANSSQIMNTQFSNNRAGVHGGAIFVHSGVFYYLDELSTPLPEETAAVGDSPKVNGLYRIGYIPTYSTVYIDPNVIDHDNYRNTLSSAFGLVNPNGIIESLNGNDVYEISAGMHDFAKSNVTIIGHNTIINVLGYLTISEYASDFTVENIIFQGSPDHVFVWKGENGKIINCTFQNNIAEGDDAYGAALDIEAKNMQIINTTFKNNRIDNSALVGGAAIYFNSTELIIDNCTFDSNVANIASNIYIVDTGKNILINKSRFTNNVAFNNHGQYGGILSYGSNINITDCLFENNTVTGGIGAALVFNSVVGIVNLESNDFINNHATQGGAIYFMDCPRYTSNGNDFTNNVATQGGAIYVAALGLTVSGDTFTGNTATNGGAIYWNGDNGQVSDCTFSSNVASSNGGAIYVNGNNLDVNHCEFNSNNRAVDGSAIYLANGKTITLTDDTFTNNYASDHGTVYISDSASINPDDLTFNANNPDNIYFAGNYVASEFYVSQSGGGTGMTSSDPTTLTTALGHIADGGRIIFTSDIILSAVAAISGKNIALVGNNHKITATGSRRTFTITDSIVNIENLTFDSFSTSDCVVYYDSASSGSVVNTNFTNQKSGTRALDIEGQVDVNNCVFKNNILSSGGALYYGSSATGTVLASTFNNTRNLYLANVNAVTVSGNTFVCPNVIIDEVTSPVDYHGSVTINGTFDDGTNRHAHDINIYSNGDLINTASIGSDNKFSYNYVNLLNDDYTITLSVVDDGNTYLFTPPSMTFTVSQADVIYIGPAVTGDGNGSDASNLATWDTIGNRLKADGTVYFTAGTYYLNGKSINSAWTLNASSASNVIINGGGQANIFSINVAGVKIYNLTLINAVKPITGENVVIVKDSVLEDQLSIEPFSNPVYGDTITITGSFGNIGPSTLTASSGTTTIGTSTLSGSTYTITRNGNLGVGSYTLSATKKSPKRRII